jgi:superfamily II DNA/RNA helicase
MLDMGFKPVVERLVAMTPDDRQTLLFSATLDGAIGQIAKQFTRDAVRHEHVHAAEQQGKIEHRFLRVSHAAKTDALVAELRHADRGRTLVFVRTKRGADRLTKKLAGHDINVAAMHGDKSQSQREKALARFESGHIDTLIATDVAARGIDVAEITHVINFDIPGATEDYVHRVGRTARAGASGVGITFVVDDQARDVARMGNQLGLQSELAIAGIVSNSAPRGARPGGGNRGRSANNRGGNGRNRSR